MPAFVGRRVDRPTSHADSPQRSSSIAGTRRRPRRQEYALAMICLGSLPRDRSHAEQTYFNPAEAYELISAPSAISTIFGVFQAIRSPPIRFSTRNEMIVVGRLVVKASMTYRAFNSATPPPRARSHRLHRPPSARSRRDRSSPRLAVHRTLAHPAREIPTGYRAVARTGGRSRTV